MRRIATATVLILLALSVVAMVALAPAAPTQLSRLYNLTGLQNRLVGMSGFKCVMKGGAATTWVDRVGAVNMTLQGGAAHSSDGEYVTFDGTSGQYATTTGAPSWATGFAGAIVTPALSYNYSGFSVVMLIRCQPGNLAGRTLIQWDNAPFDSPTGAGTDWTNFNLYVDDNGLLWCWCRASSVEGGHLTTPPLDRLFNFKTDAGADIDFRPLLSDGQWHLLVVARGSTNPPEAKGCWIDGQAVTTHFGGNGINLFNDFTTAFTLGRAFTTTMTSDPGLENIFADVGMLAIRSGFTTAQEAQAIYSASLLGGGREGNGIGGRAERKLRHRRKKRKSYNYPIVRAGQWVQPVRRGYRMKCCDCGLVHVVDFRLLNFGSGRKKIQFRAYRRQRPL